MRDPDEERETQSASVDALTRHPLEAHNVIGVQILIVWAAIPVDAVEQVPPKTGETIEDVLLQEVHTYLFGCRWDPSTGTCD